MLEPNIDNQEYAERVLENNTVIYENDKFWVYDTSYILYKDINKKYRMAIAQYISVLEHNCSCEIELLDERLLLTLKCLENGDDPGFGYNSNGKGRPINYNREMVGCSRLLVSDDEVEHQKETVKELIIFLRGLNLKL